MTIVDDFSRAVWLYLLPDKVQVSARLREFVAFVKRQFERDIKILRSDNGTEFMCLTKYFRENGISHETSCVGTPQQNGRVERKHHHILNVARALRFQAGLPIEFWAECALTACYLINRTPSRLLHNKTPFEMLYDRQPAFTQLRVFGCLCFAHNLDHHGDKFASRSRRCVFLGYTYGKKGWRLYDLEREVVFTSRDVVFQEDVFPYLTQSSPVVAVPSPIITPPTNPIVDDLSADVTPPITLVVDNSASPSSDLDSDTTSENDTTTDLNNNENTNLATNENSELPAESLGCGCRQKIPSTRLKDYVVPQVPSRVNEHVANIVSVTPLSLTPSPSDSSGTDHPLSDYHTCERFSDKHRSYLVALTVAVEPRSYKEAMRDERWNGAMRSEVDALELNHTWDLVDLPPEKIAIGSMWVYKIKLRADGSLERYKARLVALGNNQVAGVDYGETFALVAKMSTVRIFLDIAAKQDYEVHQMDVHNAFLHGDLDEEVYMKLPPGFRSDSDKRVCRLRKSLYSLKQAPRCWFAKLAAALRTFGFTQARADYSLFVYSKNGVTSLSLEIPLPLLMTSKHISHNVFT